MATHITNDYMMIWATRDIAIYDHFAVVFPRTEPTTFSALIVAVAVVEALELQQAQSQVEVKTIVFYEFFLVPTVYLYHSI